MLVTFRIVLFFFGKPHEMLNSLFYQKKEGEEEEPKRLKSELDIARIEVLTKEEKAAIE